MPPICALLDGFAIGARVALLWQHNANPLQVRTRNVSECSVLALCLVRFFADKRHYTGDLRWTQTM